MSESKDYEDRTPAADTAGTPAADGAAAPSAEGAGAPAADGAEPTLAELAPWSVHDRHDLLLKSIMKRKANVESALARVLPQNILDEIDLSRAERAPTEYVTSLLERRQSDEVFMVPAGPHELMLHLLVDEEHQSSMDKKMAVRCFIYAGLLTEGWMKAHPDDDEVPPVVSVVLYHGTAQWTAPRTLLDSYALTKGQRKRMQSSLYRGGYRLDDLQAEDVHTLADRPQTFQLRLGYVVLKLDVEITHGSRRRYHQALGLLAEMLAKLLRPAMAEQDGGKDLELEVFSYLGSSGSIKEEDVTRLYEQLGPDDQEAAMSLLQTTANKGAARQLLRMLRERFRDLPEDTVRTVNGGSQSDLDRWFLQFVNAATLDDVFR